MTSSDPKTAVVRRRLLLAKELYVHARDHSLQGGSLNQMIAVHNFHNAVEVVLRAIMLQHEIPQEKQLNINFEAMLNEIDKHFKEERGPKIPYRQDLRTLNQERNHVQHHALPSHPDKTAYLSYVSERFLKQACEDYFELDFDQLSRVDWIDDDLLKKGLKQSESSITEGNYKRSLLLSKIAFQWAAELLVRFLPKSDSWTEGVVRLAAKSRPKSEEPEQDAAEASDYYDSYVMKKGLLALRDIVEATRHWAALLSSGVAFSDYKRFELCTPAVSGAGTSPFWRHEVPLDRDTPENAKWVLDFVVRTIVYWQEVGLAPQVRHELRTYAEQILEEGDPSWSKFLNPTEDYRMP